MGIEVTSVSWLGQLTVGVLRKSLIIVETNNYNNQETEVTSTPTRPADNVVITTKDLQDRNNNCLMEGRWKIKVY